MTCEELVKKRDALKVKIGTLEETLKLRDIENAEMRATLKEAGYDPDNLDNEIREAEAQFVQATDALEIEIKQLDSFVQSGLEALS